MICLFWRWVRRVAFGLLFIVLVLLLPVAYTETMCRPMPGGDAYRALITDAAWQRPETGTLMSYPAWHIVHAYEDYAEVLRTGDPHDFDYLKSVFGFWSSLCVVTEASGAHGGVPPGIKQRVYTIGVSFTVELAVKALYEETLGRLAATLRGPERSPLDILSAEQAANYAAYLSQLPWYRWDFRADLAALTAASTGSLRDRERNLALGIELRTRSGYAKLIAAAAAGVGPDELTLRSVVSGITATELRTIPGVTVIAERPDGTEIETPRHAEFTSILEGLAARGAKLVEIAGNDDILFTALSDEPWADGEIYQFQRQGFRDYRHLILVKVADLLAAIAALPDKGLRLEQVHDY